PTQPSPADVSTFFFNPPPTTEIYTLSLHDALPIFLLLDMRAGQLHLDDVRAEQRRHVRGIGADIERQFAVLRELAAARIGPDHRSEEHTSELQSRRDLVCRLLLEKKKKKTKKQQIW